MLYKQNITQSKAITLGIMSINVNIIGNRRGKGICEFTMSVEFTADKDLLLIVYLFSCLRCWILNTNTVAMFLISKAHPVSVQGRKEKEIRFGQKRRHIPLHMDASYRKTFLTRGKQRREHREVRSLLSAINPINERNLKESCDWLTFDLCVSHSDGESWTCGCGREGGRWMLFSSLFLVTLQREEKSRSGFAVTKFAAHCSYCAEIDHISHNPPSCRLSTALFICNNA